MDSVGIIANPAAGKDIRRLVAHARYVPNQEKVNVLRRLLAGLEAAGVRRVVMMPDAAMLGRAATDGIAKRITLDLLHMSVFNEDRDSTKAAELMAGMGVGCIVTLGGDGTNRAVVKGSRSVPLVAISTGTNNVFPTMVEGTVAGLAAGVVARGLVDLADVTDTRSILEVRGDDSLYDIALVDIAVSSQVFVGARAIWDVDTLHEVFLARAEPGTIGLSAIGAQLRPSGADSSAGLHIRLGQGGISITAPVGPGMVASVPVRHWSALPAGMEVEIELRPCTVALDGERTFTLSSGQGARVSLSDKGPPVVSVTAALSQAAKAGVFADGRIAPGSSDAS